MQRQPRPLRGSLPRHQVGLERADDDRGIIQLLLEDERLRWGKGPGAASRVTRALKINAQAFQETGPGEPRHCLSIPGGSSPKSMPMELSPPHRT